MPTTKKKPVPAPSPAPFLPGEDVCKAADEYLSASATCRANEPLKERAKKVLLAWIGTAITKTLPDGRVLIRSEVLAPAELKPRKATQRVSIHIYPAPNKA
jgi:hypothetical protein